MSDKTENAEYQFDWIQMHNELDKSAHIETQKEKLIRKIKENPFVPIGTSRLFN